MPTVAIPRAFIEEGEAGRILCAVLHCQRCGDQLPGGWILDPLPDEVAASVQEFLEDVDADRALLALVTLVPMRNESAVITGMVSDTNAIMSQGVH